MYELVGLDRIGEFFVSARHTLRAEVGTVHRGVFDAALPAVLTIASGDIVEVTTLSGNADVLPDAQSGFTLLPEHRAVLAGVAPGEGPHFMTGPIAVEGAMPDDELVVDIIAMELAQDWGWNRMAPGWGTLPEHFPHARRIHVGVDRSRGVVTMPWGLQLQAAPFFGIIGVAPPPALGAVTSVIPRAFGGNIDNKHLGANAPSARRKSTVSSAAGRHSREFRACWRAVRASRPGDESEGGVEKVCGPSCSADMRGTEAVARSRAKPKCHRPTTAAHRRIWQQLSCRKQVTGRPAAA
jgi:hypothetical protein